MALSSDKKLLAVSRSNCSIEIWQVKTWSQLLVIPGNLNCPIKSLHWLEQGEDANSESTESNPFYFGGKKRRLVSTSLNGTVVEWDLLTKSIRARFSAQAAIWNSKLVGKTLYLACEDGSIKLVKVKKEKIELQRTLVKQEVRCLSLEVTSDQKYIFAGYSDSSIRKWELETGNCVLHFQKQTKKAK